MTTNATARRAFYLRHVVHLAVAGAENTLCGVRLIGAIDTTAEATCDRCAAHRFETTPGLWAQVAPIGDGELGEIGGLPESTAGFPTDAADGRIALTDDELAEAREELAADNAAGAAMLAETRTARLTLPARQLRRGDRIVNLTAGRAVTAFDLTIGEHVVDVSPAQADLDAGAHRRYTIAAGDLVVVDREVHLDGRPVRPAPLGPLPRA